jgi:glutathione S-transferase
MNLTLHHWQLDPFSRQVRIALAEKGMRIRLKEERIWDGRQDFLALNPAGTTPVLSFSDEGGRRAIVGARAALEWIEEISAEPALLAGSAITRAEIRRLADWFDRKFDAEVNAYILYEKMEKRMTGQGAPDPDMIHQGRLALREHLTYLATLIDARHWLSGNGYSLGDIAAAAHLSCIDYFNEVPWEKYPPVKEWYGRIKSRPSFRALLRDRLPGMTPPPHYDVLDF